jgi:hypothetical protein
MTHFTARVRLTPNPPESATTAAPQPANGAAVGAADIYRIYFHGPAYQVVDTAWRDNGRTVGQMPLTLAAHHQPPDMATVMAPRLIELCFQTAGLFEMARKGRMALPQHIDRVTTLRRPENAVGALRAVVVARPDDGGFDAQVVDAAGNVYVTMQGYRTVELPSAVDEDRLAPLRQAMT